MGWGARGHAQRVCTGHCRSCSNFCCETLCAVCIAQVRGGVVVFIACFGARAGARWYRKSILSAPCRHFHRLYCRSRFLVRAGLDRQNSLALVDPRADERFAELKKAAQLETVLHGLLHLKAPCSFTVKTSRTYLPTLGLNSELSGNPDSDWGLLREARTFPRVVVETFIVRDKSQWR